MSALILLLLISLGIAGGFLVAYLWSVRDGQFDDDYAPARRILFEDSAAVHEAEKHPAQDEIKQNVKTDS